MPLPQVSARLVWTDSDGNLCVTTPVRSIEDAHLSDEQIIARARARLPAGVVPAELDIADIPQDRTFRNAWKAAPGRIEVDMERARGIHMGRIREVRDAEMRALDVEQLKGRDVSAEKEALRQIPQTFDLSGAKTPEELKALWPEVLPR